MANWLKSPSNNCGTVTNIDRSKNTKPNKPINKSKNLMNNWLKRPNSNASENEIDDKSQKCESYGIKLINNQLFMYN